MPAAARLTDRGLATISPIVNLPVFKNTGNAISMATKNIGYGAVCNTNRLHAPLFLAEFRMPEGRRSPA